MNKHRSIITNLFLFVFLVYPDTRLLAKGQSSDSRYQQAYAEISDMLDGKQPLSIKRAVYLAEWAYLDGELDYEEDFCKEITRVAAYIRQVIALNHFEHYKTARQFMLCDYFFRPCNGNGLPNRHCVDMLRSTYWTQETEELLDKWNHGKDPKDVQIITK